MIIHDSAYSGIEIWGNTIGRGEFSIALAALYGTAPAATVIAVMVIVTSIVGSFTAKYTGRLRHWMVTPSHRSPRWRWR
jgi:CPA2 family monovalent cation:H+ antiporter-2